MHIKTVILLGNFLFGLRDVVNLSTTFFIQLFLRFFIFFIKNAFFNVFYSWGQRFLHLWPEPRQPSFPDFVKQCICNARMYNSRHPL